MQNTSFKAHGLAVCTCLMAGQVSTAAPQATTAQVMVVSAPAGTTDVHLAAGRYVLVNVTSGKCVDVAGASLADGGNIQQATCSSNLAQSFDVSETAAGVYKLINTGSGKAMDVASSAMNDGANVQQWVDNGTNAQRFRIEHQGGDVYTLVNVNSSKCVDVASSSLNDGANIQQYSCNHTGAQQFKFYPRTSSGRSLLPVGMYALKSVYSQLCLDIEAGSTADGARSQQSICNDAISQRFALSAEPGGAYRMVNLNSGKSLDIAGVSTANGAPLQQWTSLAGNNQRFLLSASGGGVAAKAVHSGKCVDVSGWSQAVGGRIQQWDCAGTANQQWLFQPVRVESPPPPPRAGWELLWRDEFDGTAINTSKWGFEVNGYGGGNNELQYYTARPQNAWVANGVLNIQALREHFCSTDGCREFTSARMRTKGKGDWLYGRVEVRAKLPGGQGLWPAIWMLPTDEAYGGWAASGEIDIMEAVNAGAAGGNSVHGSIHFGAPSPGNQYQSASYQPPRSVIDNFHTYAIEWEPGQIRWYVDGVQYATQTAWWSSAGAYPAPFDQRFHLLLNVAVGGNWPGSPDGTTRFPQKMEVDYVRVFKKAGS